MRNKISSAEIKIIRDNMHHSSSYEIAKMINRNSRTVRWWRSRLYNNHQSKLEVIAVCYKDVAFIPLGGRKYRNLSTLVSTDDLYKVLPYFWSPSKDRHGFYARSRQGQMHRMIMDATPNQKIDHINNNGLDNRRENLRFATQAQNRMNTRPLKKQKSRYKGLHWFPKLGKWGARIKGKHLGVFETEEVAAKAYDKAARREFGEFAYLNFPS